MRLKTYAAPTVARAMEMVRREMGPDAIIVSTETGAAGGGARVTAALEDASGDDAAVGRWEAEVRPARDIGADLKEALSFHGVPQGIAEHLLEVARGLTGESTVMALAGAFDSLFAFEPLAERSGAKPLMLVGAPGAGKTIAAAKLATRAHRAGRRPCMITTDTLKAGGVEQLQAFTDILGLPLVTARSPADLAAAVAKADGRDVLIDTAGVNPFADVELEHLRELVAAAAAEPVMVLAAGGDALETADMATGFRVVGARKMLATRLDIARRLGGLIATAAVPSLAFTEVSINADVADGLSAINPVSLARLLLPRDTATESAPHLKEAAQ
ncbi:MAG: hypothetical protein ACFCUO_13495 [Rhodospirillales bacterium]